MANAGSTCTGPTSTSVAVSTQRHHGELSTRSIAIRSPRSGAPTAPRRGRARSGCAASCSRRGASRADHRRRARRRGASGRRHLPRLHARQRRQLDLPDRVLARRQPRRGEDARRVDRRRLRRHRALGRSAGRARSGARRSFSSACGLCQTTLRRCLRGRAAGPGRSRSSRGAHARAGRGRRRRSEEGRRCSAAPFGVRRRRSSDRR